MGQVIAVETSNPGKIFYPEDGITKAEVVAYYHSIAKYMLPHLKNRPLVFERFPNGIHGQSFYQKNAPDYYPDWMDRVIVRHRSKSGSITYAMAEDTASLVYLANQACLVIHPWLSLKDKLEYPDQFIIDLDPSRPNDFECVREISFVLRDWYDELKIPSFVKLTGSRGVHVAVPLDRSATYEEVRVFGQAITQLLEREFPDIVTTAWSKNKREGKIFLDIKRNAHGQTAVAPYSLRAKPGAPVAAPVTWEELRSKCIHSQSFNMKNIFKRLSSKGDPWKGFYRSAVSLDKALKRLG